MSEDQMRAALIVQAQAINLLMSAVASLIHGDPQDDVVRAKIDEAARSFREFSSRLRALVPTTTPTPDVWQ